MWRFSSLVGNQEVEHCKIFDDDDFGFRNITVEPPLRSSFAVTPERIEVLNASRAFEALATPAIPTACRRERVNAGLDEARRLATPAIPTA